MLEKMLKIVVFLVTALLFSSINQGSAYAGTSHPQNLTQQKAIYILGIRQSQVPTVDLLTQALLGLAFTDSTADGCIVRSKIASIESPDGASPRLGLHEFEEPMQLVLTMNVETDSEGVVSCTRKESGGCEPKAFYRCTSPALQRAALEQITKKHWGSRTELDYILHVINVVPVPGVRVSN